MKKYNVFLFDADNTLYDYNKAEANALKILFGYCGFKYTEEIRMRYREINAEVWSHFEKGEMTKDDLQTLRFSRLFDDMSVSHNSKEFNEKYLVELGKGAFLMEGSLEMCKTLTSNGKKIYIITNGLLATQEARINHSLIEEYITDYFVSEVVGFHKPNIKYFDYVINKINVKKEEALVIGDSLTADIAGGNNAGIDTCWFNPDGIKNNTDNIPTYEIKKLEELINFI